MNKFEQVSSGHQMPLARGPQVLCICVCVGGGVTSHPSTRPTAQPQNTAPFSVIGTNDADVQ